MPHHGHLVHRHAGPDGQHLQYRNASPDPAPAPLAQPDANADPMTIVSVVYVTASPTFSGPVGGYSTLGPIINSPSVATSANVGASVASSLEPVQSAGSSPATSSQTEQASSAAASAVASTAPVVVASSSSAIQSLLSTDSSLTASSLQSLSTSVSGTSLLATSSPTPTNTSLSSTLVAAPGASSTKKAAGQSSSSPSPSSSSSGGMSGGAKAGLAIGLLIVIGALLGLLFFCIRRKKRQNESYGKTDDEKNALGNDDAASTAGRAASTRTARTASTAPRLSIRPVTAFLPNLGNSSKSAGNDLTMAGNAADGSGRNVNPPAKPIVNSQNQRRPNDLVNPFGNHAETSYAPSLHSPAFSAPFNPFGDHAESSHTALPANAQALDLPIQAPTQSSAASPQSRATASNSLAAPAIAGFAVGAAAGAASERQKAPAPLDFAKHTEGNQDRSASPAAFLREAQPSPAGTEFSMSSMPGTPVKPQSAAIVGAGASAASNVHRVQLDFKPSMDDELELRAGQLVRMLHEYDDGWALCIRLDRSQQGVTPRTCLSTRPVKPRIAGSSQSRGTAPSGMRNPPQGRPTVPSNGPMGANQGRNSPVPFVQATRPLSPAGRPMSPAGRQAPSQQSPTTYVGPPRSRSPGPYAGQERPKPPTQRRRSNSAGQVQARRNSPPGPSPMNPNASSILQRLPTQLRPGSPLTPQQAPVPVRKPVPGQAM
ncbi:MAG: hypothetical protein M1827_006840 [Pycnora praestabilis]|nr:MAG: hypothetical protein M1827_006840 [Pycnora praestabilis]